MTDESTDTTDTTTCEVCGDSPAAAADFRTKDGPGNPGAALCDSCAIAGSRMSIRAALVLYCSVAVAAPPPEVQHTPGPWVCESVNPAGDHSIRLADPIGDGGVIAKVFASPTRGGPQDMETLLNARLVTAAPDMRALLQRVARTAEAGRWLSDADLSIEIVELLDKTSQVSIEKEARDAEAEAEAAAIADDVASINRNLAGDSYATDDPYSALKRLAERARGGAK